VYTKSAGEASKKRMPLRIRLGNPMENHSALILEKSVSDQYLRQLLARNRL
jgi:hypothetical protein